MPDDVDASDEAAFRKQIRELAFTVKLPQLHGACYLDSWSIAGR